MLLEVFSECVRGAQGETDRCKITSRTQIRDKEDSNRKFFLVRVKGAY